MPFSPSKFKRKGELVPPTNSTSSTFKVDLEGLYIFNLFVVDPMVVNTVSKTTVSVEKVKFSFENVNDFLHPENEKPNKIPRERINENNCFDIRKFDFKNNVNCIKFILFEKI